MERHTAENIIENVNQSLGILNKLLCDVQTELSDDELAILKRGVAKVMNIADTSIVQHILDQYPELSPWG